MQDIISGWLVVVMVAALWSPVLGKGITERTITNDQAQKKIIIGIAASDFKNKIIDALVEKYRGVATIEIRELGKLADINPQDYNVIVAMDALWGGLKLNTTFKKVAEKLKDSGKLVVLMTAGDPDYKLDYKGVDAVSTASVKGKEQDVAAKIAEKIDAILRK